MQVDQNDLVLLPYPFSNLKDTKVRPALIISNDNFNRKSDDCLMVPLTSVIKDEPYSIIIQSEDLSSGKLLQTSRIRADKIFCAEKSLILLKIGTVNSKILNLVKQELLKLF
jgi:mRNA interferase MazF